MPIRSVDETKTERDKTILLIVLLVLAINCKVSTAIALHCKFEAVWIHSNLYYTCSGTILLETQTSQSLSAIYGTHQPGKGNENVLGMNILSQGLQFYPTNIEEFFPNVMVIDFANNSITSVSNTNLSPKLWYLSLASNRISVLERNLFVGLNSLQYLYLNDNKVTSIDSNIFATLFSSSFIDLSNNTIRHVGHDLILPKHYDILLWKNICVDAAYSSFYDVEGFKFELLTRCPPSISLIESTLEIRPNFIKNLIDRIAEIERQLGN